MGTREVYEQKLKSGHLHHDPTLNPGLGTPRCPRCLSLLDPNSDKGDWTLNPLLYDATAVAGSGIGGMLSAVHGFNTGIPYLQNRLKGPKWLPFLVGLPPLLLFSAASAGFGGAFVGASLFEPFCDPLWLYVMGNPNYWKFILYWGYALPKFAQLVMTSYHASFSASHYGISLLTRHIEETHMSRSQQERVR